MASRSSRQHELLGSASSVGVAMQEILARSLHLIPNLPAAIVSVFATRALADQLSQAQTLVAVEHWHSSALDEQTIIIIIIQAIFKDLLLMQKNGLRNKKRDERNCSDVVKLF